MFSTKTSSGRALRAALLGVVTFSCALAATVDTADARRHRRHSARSEARQSYNPAFASIIVDANSGATLSASNADGLRHPASLTKIMTLYLLFEKLESGKLKLDSEMDVSAHASSQAPTKLGLKPGSSLAVEDAIKGLVTRSANDAAVVIAEAIAGDEDDFAKQMTRKARALGMTRTVYRNASGLPDDEQVTTARDQSLLGRAIQERFPRYYRYFATSSFVYRGRAIRNHNRLLGSVEGVDGIKTGYTRASGFNLVTSMKRGNRHLVGVVLGGRSGGSRDAIMRGLLAANLEKASARRTVAAITERSVNEANAEVAEDRASRPGKMVQTGGGIQIANAAPDEEEPAVAAAPGPTARSTLSARAAIVAPQAAPRPRNDPSPLTSGVIQTQPIAAIPGSSEPMKPVRVKTVQVKSGGTKLASATPAPAASTPARNEASIAASFDTRAEMPRQPANHGTGQGILGVLPASTVAPARESFAVAARSDAPAAQVNGAIKPVTPNHSGWMVQVGALETEGQARQRLDDARTQARDILAKADPFTETVAKGDKKLVRARFAGLDRQQAEAACRTLKRSEMSCITIRN